MGKYPSGRDQIYPALVTRLGRRARIDGLADGANKLVARLREMVVRRWGDSDSGWTLTHLAAEGRKHVGVDLTSMFRPAPKARVQLSLEQAC